MNSRAQLPATVWLAVVLAITSAGCSRPPASPPALGGAVDRPLAELIESRRRAVSSAPESADAWGHLGQAFQSADFSGEARLCFSNAVRLQPRSDRWQYLLGLAELPEAPESGLAHLGMAVALAAPGNECARMRLAQLWVERGGYEKARPLLAEVLRARPGDPAALVEQARMQLAAQELAPAESSLKPALDHPETLRPALLLLAQIRQRQGDRAGAAEMVERASAAPRLPAWPDSYLREVQELRMDRPNAQDRINVALQERSLVEARRLLDSYFERFPDDPDGWLLRGRVYLLERDCVAADGAFRRSLALRPDFVNGLMQLALAELCQERWSAAAATLRRTLALKPDYAQALFNLALAQDRLGDAAGALASLREAQRYAPGDPGVGFALGEALWKAGARDEARAQLQRLLRADPADERARRFLEQMRASR